MRHGAIDWLPQPPWSARQPPARRSRTIRASTPRKIPMRVAGIGRGAHHLQRHSSHWRVLAGLVLSNVQEPPNPPICRQDTVLAFVSDSPGFWRTSLAYSFEAVPSSCPSRPARAPLLMPWAQRDKTGARLSLPANDRMPPVSYGSTRDWHACSGSAGLHDRGRRAQPRGVRFDR